MSVHVSDHALLRYFERVGGVDVEGLRRELARDLMRATSAADALGVGQYTVRLNGYGYFIRANVVVTILTPKMPGALMHAEGA